VKVNADDILSRLNGTGGPLMPPVLAGGPWPQANIDLFQQWMQEGFQP
jgi:hypothetical protein